MKVTVITGAASGIGLALSTLCLKKEFTVVMADKDEAKLNSAAEQLKTLYPHQVKTMICDVTSVQEVNQLAKRVEQELSRVDWIFNNAGIIGHLAPLWELKPEQIQSVLGVNLYGMTNIIHAFAPFLFRQSFRSHITNMASLYALCAGSQLAPYSMSKHAVLALSESLHFDLQRLEKPVDVSVVFPSFTDTSLLSHTPSDEPSAFHDSLNALLGHSRPAMEVAAHIIEEVEHKKFYIFPDKEVKGYCEERTQAMITQADPHRNNVEKLMGSLIRRSKR
jgi:NAD(P)-dependent dehydrogenase (short-subunit alcohol dehydrogenase family)